MGRRTVNNDMPAVPERRMLTAAQAADYLGLPIMAFKRECPVQPVRIGRHVRWDRKALDSWVDSFSTPEYAMPADYWIARFEFFAQNPPKKGRRRSGGRS